MPGLNPVAGQAAPAAAPASEGAAQARPKDDPAAIARAASQFEALLITQLIRAARGDTEGWLGSGEDQAASSALELAEEQFAEALAAQGGLGLASLIVSGLQRS
jgi:Rod binding domain-containing protein